MNIARLSPAKKKEIWARLQNKQPDVARFIQAVTRSFPGDYLVIDVSKIQDRPEPLTKNIWEGCGLKIK